MGWFYFLTSTNKKEENVNENVDAEINSLKKAGFIVEIFFILIEVNINFYPDDVTHHKYDGYLDRDNEITTIPDRNESPNNFVKVDTK